MSRVRQLSLPHRQRGFWWFLPYLAAAIGGAAVASAIKTPKIDSPTQPAAPPDPQAPKAPSATDTRTGITGVGQSAGAPGIAQTMLTGAGGVDPGQLKLGRSTLLGS